MTETGTHQHRTTDVEVDSGPFEDGLVPAGAARCATCGRLMAEIRAERDLAMAAAAGRQVAPAVDERTYEQRLCDQERRRGRYRRTGK
jgi:hypothetical protein